MALKLSKNEWELSEGIRDLRARAASLDTLVTEKDALIERLQKELGEAREIIRSADEKLAAAGLRSGCFMGCDTPDALADRIEDIRAKTIEECAKVAETFIGPPNEKELWGRGITDAANDIAKAIRSMDGGGK